MHRCCTTGPAGTFFGFIATSSVAVFILPIAAQIVSDPAYFSTVMAGSQSNSSAAHLHEMSAGINNLSVFNDHRTESTFAGINVSNILHFFTYHPYAHITDSLSRNFNSGYIGNNYTSIGISNSNNFVNSSSYSVDIIQSNINSNAQTVNDPSSHTSFWPVFSTIVVSLILYRVTATSAFSTLGIIANDSVDKELRGEVYTLHITQLHLCTPCSTVYCTKLFYSLLFIFNQA